MARAAVANQAASEQDQRLALLNQLLTTPHRKLEQAWPFHENLVKQDPLFYQRLAAWYDDHGEIRDHKECFCAALCLSDFEGHRDVGLALLRELPPYQLIRVVDWVHGTKKTKKLKAKKDEEVKTEVVAAGLNHNIPRAMRTEITRYLQEREADNEWFDSSAITARAAMKRLYALNHIKPSKRAQKILFDESPPEDSKAYLVKTLANAKTPAEQAKAIVENKIPYRIASTVVSAMTPTVMLALIETMSSQELINNMGSLKKRGAFDNPETKALIESKLVKAKTDKRVSALKSKEAIKAAGVSAETEKQLEDIADSQVKARGRIKRSTALLVDKSGSMTQAIELGKQIAAMISTVMDAQFYMYAFDLMSYPIVAKGTTITDWEKALRGISAGGGTACGVALKHMIRERQYVEQIVLCTDEQETSAPYFWDTLAEYKAATNANPSVIIVKTIGATNQLEADAVRKGQAVDAWQFSKGSDYFALPGLIQLLVRPSKLDLLLEIMSYPLPKRKAS